MCAEKGIVWLVDGEVRPFEALEEVRRPWLEESAAWGQPDVPNRDKDGEGDKDGDEPPQLVWL